jgi:nucleotide-binding universal stress UspA family protein
VTHARQPVLVVRAAAAAFGAPVVVGVDGSTTAVRAVQMAADEADRAGVPLRALAAVPVGADATGTSTGPRVAELRDAEAFLSEALAGLRERYPGLSTELAITQTHPIEALVRASLSARLVVVGSRGRSAMRSLVLGSVGREVAQRAACNVLVVHPGPPSQHREGA